MDEISIECLKAALTLKSQFPDIFYIKILDVEFLFRPLKYSEFRAIGESDLPPEHLNDLIFENVVLYRGFERKFLDCEPAGIVDSLVEAVKVCSGFGDEQIIVPELERHRQETDNVESLIELFVCTAFPSITPLKVREMTFHEQMRSVVLAEAVLKVKFPIGQEQERPKKRGRRSPEASAVLSKSAADAPDFDKDNKVLRDL